MLHTLIWILIEPVTNYLNKRLIFNGNVSSLLQHVLLVCTHNAGL